MHEPIFYCDRRDMPVAADLSDCLGCPQRTWPTPCPQFKEHYDKNQAEKLSGIFKDYLAAQEDKKRGLV